MTKEEINFNIRHVVNMVSTSLFLVSECARLEAVVKELENKNKGLEMSMPKDPNHPDCIIVLKSGFDAFLHLAKEEVKQAELERERL